MSRPRRKKKNPKFSYIQEWGSYPNQMFVCVGLTQDEIVRSVKAKNGKKWFLEFLEKERPSIVDSMHCNGFFLYHASGASVLWLKEWEDDWAHYETLLHELHHAVHFCLGELRAMSKEAEGLAYQQEWLFRQVRRRLNDRFFPKKHA